MQEPIAKKLYLGRQAEAEASTTTTTGALDVEVKSGWGFLKTSHTVADCLRKWSGGLLQSTEVQEVYFHAYQDQVALLNSLNLSTDHVNPALTAIARLGNWGSTKGMLINIYQNSSAIQIPFLHLSWFLPSAASRSLCVASLQVRQSRCFNGAAYLSPPSICEQPAPV